MVSALMKLAGGAPTLAAELNVDAFLRQARSYDEASAGPLGWYIRRALSALGCVDGGKTVVGMARICRHCWPSSILVGQNIALDLRCHRAVRRNAQTRALSHPLPVMRAREIDQWSRSPQYVALLESSRPPVTKTGQQPGSKPEGVRLAVKPSQLQAGSAPSMVSVNAFQSR